MTDMLTFPFMQRALLAALLVGAAAPLVGIFLVQRRLSLIGDGMGHVALAGVAIGVLTGQQPVASALALTVIGAIVIELISAYGKASADIALAVMFYGGIALGVVLMGRATGADASLNSYLFGAITTTSKSDLVTFAVLAIVVMAVTTILRPRLFAVANDEEYARAVGMPVLAFNIVLAVLTAVTVVVSMRVVGLLLISALMILPNAAAQLVARSFRSAMAVAVAIGVVCATGGVATSYQLDTASGGTIVLLAIGTFVVLALLSGVVDRARAARHPQAELHEHEHGPGCGHEPVPHDGHVDYLHDGHRHVPHEAHYDECDPAGTDASHEESHHA